MKEQNNIEESFDSLFKEQLGNQAVTPPAHVWAGVSGSLATNASIWSTLLGKIIIGTASVLAVSSVVYFSINNTNVEKEATNQKVISEQNQIVSKNELQNVQIPSENFENKLLVQKDNVITKEKKKEVPNLNLTSEPKNDHEIVNQEVKKDDNLTNINQEKDNQISKEDAKNLKEKDGVEKAISVVKDEKTDKTPNPNTLLKVDSSYIFIPDAVTPNNDGLNDEYLIDIKGEEYVQIIIFDQFNSRLFDTKDKTKSWNCTLKNGELAPSGTYIVKVIYKFKNKTEKSTKRVLTLIR
ncbi:gliding motility-associated C-terminal domain-containing protein [Flavobacterium filum]|uniref:T9SS type B sorting domain-containing protein n=1 Tax=Flavobacterium filum TaxID=370974 RepID=UPI0023F25727|nr:gliding motility-associated C-terminal domain-containing protein [Flavobacterium filum]